MCIKIFTLVFKGYGIEETLFDQEWRPTSSIYVDFMVLLSNHYVLPHPIKSVMISYVVVDYNCMYVSKLIINHRICELKYGESTSTEKKIVLPPMIMEQLDPYQKNYWDCGKYKSIIDRIILNAKSHNRHYRIVEQSGEFKIDYFETYGKKDETQYMKSIVPYKSKILLIDALHLDNFTFKYMAIAVIDRIYYMLTTCVKRFEDVFKNQTNIEVYITKNC